MKKGMQSGHTKWGGRRDKSIWENVRNIEVTKKNGIILKFVEHWTKYIT